MTYIVAVRPQPHVCWFFPDWDGCIVSPGECEGCDEAAQHPCVYCGYGGAFTTHNPDAHLENGDSQCNYPPPDRWLNAPHVYLDGLTYAEESALILEYA